MVIPYNASSVILFITLNDSSGDPITGIAFNTASFTLNIYIAGNASAITPTLVDGTLGTFVADSWKEVGGGIYQFCPNDSHLSPGKMTLLDFAVPTHGNHRDHITCVGVDSECSDATLANQTTILSNIGAASSNLSFVFNIPNQAPITVENNIIYVKEKNRVLEFTASENIEAVDLTLIFEDANGFDVLVVENGDLTKVGNLVTYVIPDSMTEAIGSITWAFRKGSDYLFAGKGTFNVIYAPFEDIQD